MSAQPQRPGATSHALRAGLVLTLFLLVTLWALWPLARSAGDHIVDSRRFGPRGAALLAADSWLNVWILSWDTHALTTEPTRLFHANIFYPAPWTLTLSEHLLGYVPLFAPVYLATGNPVLAYNATLTLCFVLAGAGMCWLVRHWTGQLSAGIVAGLVFTFAPWRFSQLDHIQLLGLYGLPLILLFWDRALAEGRWCHLVGVGGAFLLQCLCSYYVAYCTVIATILYAAATAVRTPIPRVARAAGALAVASVVLALVSLPYLWARTSGLIPAAADPTALTLARVPGWRPYVFALGTFPGIAPYQGRMALVLAAAGIATLVAFPARRTWRAATVAGLLLIGGVGYVLALGPGDYVEDGLYAWLFRVIPGFSLVRVPARFLILVAFAVAAMAGLGWALVVAGLRGTLRWTLTAAVAVLVLWDVGLLRSPPLPLAHIPSGPAVPAVYQWLGQHGNGEPLLELPAREPIADLNGAFREGQYAYFSTVHWLPQLTGRSGYRPRVADLLLPLARRLPDPHALRLLARLTGLRWIVVHGDAIGAAERRRWEAATLPGLDPVATLGPDRVYRVTLDVEPEWREELVRRLRGTPERATFQGTPLAPLSAADLRAEFTRFDVPQRISAGIRTAARITLRNTGTRTWPGLAVRDEGLVMLQLGWRTPGDAPVRPFVAALRLTEDVPPEGEAMFAVSLPAPRRAGRYRLLATMIQNGGRAGTEAVVSVEVVARR